MRANVDTRVFVKYGAELKLIEVDLPGWLNLLRNDISLKRYAPETGTVVVVPKACVGLHDNGVVYII
jgi:hypothetical protein